MNLSLIIEMGWKSALIAGAALLLVTLLRSRSAADRAAILQLTIVLLLFLPLVVLAFPALQIETPTALTSVDTFTQPLDVATTTSFPDSEVPQPPMAMPAEASPSFWKDSDLLIGCIWLAGLIAISMRLGIGLLTLRRWTARARTITSPEWIEALIKTDADSNRPLLLVSESIPAPVSWGWRKTAILIDENSLKRPEDAEAILAHEMAHIKRHDWISLILARAAVAIFWFNPLVWLIEREISQQAEEAADNYALGQIEPTRYAQTLVTCAKYLTIKRVPANSIAPSNGSLARRVNTILESKGPSIPSGSRATLIAMLVCLGFAVPVAALKLIPVVPTEPALFTVAGTNAIFTAPVLASAAAQASVPMSEKSARANNEEPESDFEFDVKIDEEAINREVDTLTKKYTKQTAKYARRDAERAIAHAQRDVERTIAYAQRDAERAIAYAQRDAERNATLSEGKVARTAHRATVKGLTEGADGMMRGAEGMEHGAKKMDEEAARLGSADYRARKIAEAARQGKILTHQQLIEVKEELREGAEELRENAKEMRKAAEEMRRQAT